MRFAKKRPIYRDITEEFIPTMYWEPEETGELFKIFRLNEYEYWAGLSLEDCIKEAMKQTGLSMSEVTDSDARELSEEEMESFKRGDEYTKRSVSFVDALKEDLEFRVLNGFGTTPFCFAGTEW